MVVDLDAKAVHGEKQRARAICVETRLREGHAGRNAARSRRKIQRGLLAY
jgi:hypothetical protein